MMLWIENLVALMREQGGVQWAAFGFNCAYVLLATREDLRCWYFGFVGTILTFIVTLEANLKSDALLQVYCKKMISLHNQLLTPFFLF